ncbi:hypothetical protein D9M69_494900 [compost metagenome]
MKSIERARVASEVSPPTITSTMPMRGTGEKKCRPMKFAGRGLACASSLIGSAEVLEAKIASAFIAATAASITTAFTLASSTIASTTRSQLPSAA